MNAGHCDTQNNIPTTTCTLNFDDLDSGWRLKWRSITIIATMLGMIMMLARESQFNHGSARKLKDIKVC